MSDASRRGSSTAAPTVAAHSPNGTRRRFLIAFGAGAAGAASASALAATPAAVVEAVDAKPESQGYSETDHVRKYYASTRRL